MGLLSLCCFVLGIAMTRVLAENGCDVTIEINPKRTGTLLNKPVTITCNVEAKLNEVLQISLSKDSDVVNPIAMIKKSSDDIIFGFQNQSHYKAEGQINGKDSRNYIELTILHPNTIDMGDYTCSVVYFDLNDTVKLDKAQANLTVETDLNKNELELVLTYLLDEVTRLESENKKLHHGVEEQEKAGRLTKGEIGKQSEEILKLKKQDKSVINEIAKVYEENMKLTEEILNLKLKESQTVQNFSILNENLSMLSRKVTQTVAFSAAITTQYEFVRRSTLKFPAVLLNKGSCYERGTGVFRAPVAGLYAFHLGISINEHRRSTLVSIEKNGRQIATLDTHDNEQFGHSSCSAVTMLDRHDTVTAVALQDGIVCGRHLLSIFNGYLIHAI